MSASTTYFSICGQSDRMLVLVRRTKAHDVFDPGAIVPAAVEDDDLAAGRKMLHVALHEHLRFLAIRRRGQRYDAEYAWTDLLGNRLDGASLAGGVPAFEQDDDLELLFLDPILELAELHGSLAQSPSSYAFRFSLGGTVGILIIAAIFGLLEETSRPRPAQC